MQGTDRSHYPRQIHIIHKNETWPAVHKKKRTGGGVGPSMECGRDLTIYLCFCCPKLNKNSNLPKLTPKHVVGLFGSRNKIWIQICCLDPKLFFDLSCPKTHLQICIGAPHRNIQEMHHHHQPGLKSTKPTYLIV